MIQVINRAFDIIELISREPKRAFSLSEIADELHLNHGTCANILKTMVTRNYLEQIGPKQGYKLGYMFYQILGETSFEDKLQRASRDTMENLTHETKETCLLAILKKENRVILHQVQSDRDLMVKTALEKEAYNSASGRLLIAMLQETELEDFVSKYGLPLKSVWPEANTIAKFHAQLKLIKKQGYARHLPTSHIFGLACAIERGGNCVASLGIYLPVSRLTKQNEKFFLKELKNAAEKIGQKMG